MKIRQCQKILLVHENTKVGKLLSELHNQNDIDVIQLTTIKVAKEYLITENRKIEMLVSYFQLIDGNRYLRNMENSKCFEISLFSDGQYINGQLCMGTLVEKFVLDLGVQG